MRTSSPRRPSGVITVEFGILLIPLVILALAITEYGHTIDSYNALVKSVHDAARYLSAHTPGDEAAHAIARCMAAFGNPDCSGQPLAPGLTTAMVQTCDAVLRCPGGGTSPSTGLGTGNLAPV